MGYFFVLFLRLVAFFEGSQKIILFIIVAVIIFTAVIINFYNNRKSGGYLLRSSTFTLVIIIVIMTHTLIFSTLSIRDSAVLVTFGLWYIYALSRFWRLSINQALSFLLISFFVYNLVNYIYYLTYFSDSKIGMNSILSFLGISGFRIFFPLSSGANINAAQIGLTTLVAIYLFKSSHSSIKKTLFILVYLFHVLLLILVDSRLILLVTLSFSVLVLFSFSQIINWIKSYWISISIGIIAFMYFFYATSFFDQIKRPGEKSGTAVNRFEIWSVASTVAFDGVKVIPGQGLNGLEKSITNQTKEIFAEQKLQTAHNLIIQILVDWGVLGLFVLFYLIKLLIRRANKINSEIIKLLIVATLILGTTEAIPTFYSFEATLFFLGVVAIINANYERKNS